MNRLESTNLNHNSTDSLVELRADRPHAALGGFSDNWDDTANNSDNIHSSPTPWKMHYYRCRIFINQPSVVYSSEIRNYDLASQALGGADSSFDQRNLANGFIKKWTLTNGAVTGPAGATGFGGGGKWSYLGHNFTKRVWSKKKGRYVTVGKPRYFNDACFKIQVKNLSPVDADATYTAIIEYGLDYDATANQ